MTLREPLVTSVRYRGRRYRLRPSFDRVLAAYKVLQNEEFSQEERADIALSYIVKGRYPVSFDLLNTILESLKAIPTKAGDDDDTPVIDFDIDAPYIYAAFMQAYGIDLYEQQGKLHWQKYAALVASLPTDTRIADIMRIRSQKVPAITRHNREEVENLMRAKARYALPVKNPEKRFEDGLRKMILSMRK